MSFSLPAPLTTVVFSLVDHTLPARSQHVHGTLSSFMPQFIRDSADRPSGSAMSSSMAYAASPSPRLDGRRLQPAAEAVHTSVASAIALDVSR